MWLFGNESRSGSLAATTSLSKAKVAGLSLVTDIVSVVDSQGSSELIDRIHVVSLYAPKLEDEEIICSQLLTGSILNTCIS
jgi:hypothetical protein